MPRVDFYLLPGHRNREHFTCELAGTIHKQGLQLYIHAGTRKAAGILDHLLWTFRDTSFLPHSLVDADAADTSTITIGWDGMTATGHEVLINLTACIPAFAGSFDRIVEIVPADDPDKQQARKRYREYRLGGFDLHNHDLRSGHVPG